MADEIDELILAGNLCKDTGYMRAAKILGREGARLIRENRHPRKKLVEVKLAHGGKAWLDRERVRDAEEIED